jgi:sec-independent protein translocase protein TatC
MRKFFSGLWWLLTLPFRLVFWIVRAPFRYIPKVYSFLTAPPDDTPLADVFTAAVQDRQVRQSIWDHIEVLRKHIFRAVLALVLTVGVSFFFTEKLVAYLAQPVGGLKALKAIEVTESVGVFMRVALISGLALALPYIAFEFWLFAAPALMPRSRQFGLLAIPLASIFFLAGMAFSYYVMLPTALPFLLNFMGIQAQLRPQSYFSFVTGLMFWIGAAFEFPLVIYALSAIRLVKPAVLAKQWRIAVVLIAILAAAITPTVDPVNMGLVMLPMILLYFISIGFSYLAYPRRKPTEEAA